MKYTLPEQDSTHNHNSSVKHPNPKGHPFQVWFPLIEQYCRRLKCEKDRMEDNKRMSRMKYTLPEQDSTHNHNSFNLIFISFLSFCVSWVGASRRSKERGIE
jgi:hypothetical protein